jgi:hypothetical protein
VKALCLQEVMCRDAGVVTLFELTPVSVFKIL